MVRVRANKDLYNKMYTKKEQDPNGIDQHEPGAKLDQGKLRPFLVYSGFRRALEEVWKDGTYGAEKYTPNGWKEVPNAKERYLDAAFRHFDDWLIRGELLDKESNVHHLGAMAWNILACLELELTELENKE